MAKAEKTWLSGLYRTNFGNVFQTSKRRLIGSVKFSGAEFLSFTSSSYAECVFVNVS